MSTTADTDGNAAREQVDDPNAHANGQKEQTDDEKDEDVGSGEESIENYSEEEEEAEQDSDEEEEDEDEEEEEPALKYERISGKLPALLKKDSASALAISTKFMALGTHAGFVYLLDLSGGIIKSNKPHQASVVDICIDETGDFIATASIDGQVIIKSLSSRESYAFDVHRPLRTVALEPSFAHRSSRAFICAGLAGTLSLREKRSFFGVGHTETVLHSSEGPIWQARWSPYGPLIAWANDLGVKIYDTSNKVMVAFIDRPKDAPRPDLFPVSLLWQDEQTLLIAWADFIKVARVRTRVTGLTVDVIKVFQLDSMLAGIMPHPMPISIASAPASRPQSITSTTSSARSDTIAVQKPNSSTNPPPLTSFLLLTFSPPQTALLDLDVLLISDTDRIKQAKAPSDRPELRIISRGGEELAADALSVSGYQAWGCGDYKLAASGKSDVDRHADSTNSSNWYVVLSPQDLILVRPRDELDHVTWLIERERYEEALEALEVIEHSLGVTNKHEGNGNKGTTGFGEKLVGGVKLTSVDVGQKLVETLVSEGSFPKAAQFLPKVCARDPKRWEDWIFVFAEKRHLQSIIPLVPTQHPRLNRVVYEMILAYFLAHDAKMVLQTIQEWPRDIYDVGAVIVAVKDELDKVDASHEAIANTQSAVLMECLAELYTSNRQPGKALPYYLKLRRPNVFELIEENNLYTDVKDMVLSLVEFEFELNERDDGKKGEDKPSRAISLLVDNVHSIPINKAVSQLAPRPKYLFFYLDALVGKDPNLLAGSGFADLQNLQVKLYADYARPRLIDFLRSSTDYDLEKAYRVCQERDLIPEMVFLLGRMGDNKKALGLIIERLGDVERAIDFAKDQADDELWEDLLKYAETRPAFIRGLLENVGPEINPIRLIRRIKNGLEIPGLKGALIKILQDFHLQISLLEGCQTILNGDSSELSKRVQRDQTSGFFLTAKSKCHICSQPLQESPQQLVLLYLCRHTVHARCARPNGDKAELPQLPDPALRGAGLGGVGGRGLSGRIAFEAMVRTRIGRGCPVCHKRSEGKS
ncbi:vacuolar assembling protein VPS41 [Lentinula aff. detonsa]|nr:vacuolar assembling protein VPS41 [Lentinula aff. detonsa]